MAEEKSRSRPKVLRPPGLAVFAGFLLLVAGLWWLFADSLVERTVESTGESLFGSQVDVDFADVRPTEGSVHLSGLTVANPDAPMRNLFEADTIIADLRLEPLLQKKVVVQQLTVTGVRFDTERETSGALENPDPEAGALWSQVNGWADAVQIPDLSLDNLGGAVRTDAIDADSLATVQFARDLVDRADSLRGEWGDRLEALDPRRRIDSVTAVADRLQSFQLSLRTAPQVPGLIRDGRAALQRVTTLRDEISALDDDVRAGIGSVAIDSDVISDLRSRDLAYAGSLLDIPSLDAPTISPALFGGVAVDWLKPVLYWANAAERFLPPGLDPRNRPGPKRTRAPGTTFDFRQGAEYPSFLLEQGDLGVSIAGDGISAGSYTARLRGLTSAPALLGEPMELTIGRTEGVQGPTGLTLAAVLDHTGPTIRDSVSLSMAGVELPDIDLGDFGGTLGLGAGRTEFSLTRTGEQLSARLFWRADAVTWTPAPNQPATEAGRDALPGSTEWARDLVWRTLTGIEQVELDMGIVGTLESPSLSIESNLGAAVAQSFRQELGREIDAAQARVREEVDRRIQPVVQDATARADGLRTQIADRVAAQRQEVEELRTRLEARVEELIGATTALERGLENGP